LLQLLAALELADGICQAELQRKLRINQSRLSKLLKKLKKADLVDEIFDYYDRRSQVSKLTDAGTQLIRFLEPELGLNVLRVLEKGFAFPW